MIPHSLKLSPESDLLDSIKEYSIRNNLYGYVSGVVGNLSNVCIQCPNTKSISTFTGELEIITLNGFFNNSDVHLHLSFSDEKCNVYGGHLEEGTLVKKGTDLLLLSFEKNIQTISKNVSSDSKRVEIYVLKNCPWSKRAVRLLSAAKINYLEILINSDNDFEKVSSLSNHNTFPQIFIEGNFFGGYDELSNQYKLDSLDLFK